MLKPHSKRADWVLIWISEGIDPASTIDDSCGFVVLTRFLIPADGLCDKFIATRKFDNNSSGISDVHTEKLLAERHHRHAGRT